MKRYITESWPATFRPELVHCSVKAVAPRSGQPDDILAEGNGVGSSCEIARGNAYAQLAAALVEKFA